MLTYIHINRYIMILFQLYIKQGICIHLLPKKRKKIRKYPAASLAFRLGSCVRTALNAAVGDWSYRGKVSSQLTNTFPHPTWVRLKIDEPFSCSIQLPFVGMQARCYSFIFYMLIKHKIQRFHSRGAWNYIITLWLLAINL